MNWISGEEKFESAISYILIMGVTASVLIEALGIASYYYAYGNLGIFFQPEFTLKGADFFSYTVRAIRSMVLGSWTPQHFLGFGLVLLMFTPYMRVVASVVHYGLAKNFKYLLITGFVFLVLTASLLIH
jgi:uncharacterized membrane protein